MGKRIGKFGLVNYADHPTNKKYTVFNFNTEREATLFEEMLNKENLYFEKDADQHEDETLYLYAVETKHFEKAQKANFMVSAKVRKNIIPNAFLRYSLILFFFAVIALAVIGYVKN